METHTDAAAAGVAHRVGEAARAWLEHMRGSFALAPDVPEDHIAGVALKSLAELSLAAGLVRREAVAGPRCAQAASRLLDFGWQPSAPTA